MCIICECNNRLTRTEFMECFTGNSHGAGFAWRGDDGLNHYIKGFMDKDKAWEAYQDVPVPHIAHFRLASAGGVTPQLTHPFIVSADSPLHMEWKGPEALLFHNGTILDWKTMLFAVCLNTGLPSGEMSDTRFVAMAMAGRMGEDVMCFFTTSKFGLLDRQGRIVRYGTWERDADNWYTNGGYKVRTYTARGWGEYEYYGRTYVDGSARRDYSAYGAYDEDETPVASQFCYNCKHYHVPMKCKKRGEITNMTRCADWKVKRGPGRPKKRKKEDNVLSPNGDTPPVPMVRQSSLPFRMDNRTCITCGDFLGEMMCSKRKEKMTNLVACSGWNKIVPKASEVGVGVRNIYDESGNIIRTIIEERRVP